MRHWLTIPFPSAHTYTHKARRVEGEDEKGNNPQKGSKRGKELKGTRNKIREKFDGRGGKILKCGVMELNPLGGGGVGDEVRTRSGDDEGDKICIVG